MLSDHTRLHTATTKTTIGIAKLFTQTQSCEQISELNEIHRVVQSKVLQETCLVQIARGISLQHIAHSLLCDTLPHVLDLICMAINALQLSLHRRVVIARIDAGGINDTLTRPTPAHQVSRATLRK